MILARPFRSIILYSFLVCLSTNLLAQRPAANDTRQLESISKKYFNNADYDKALPVLLQIRSIKGKSKSLDYKIGVCYFYKQEYISSSEYLAYVAEQKDPPDRTFDYLAKILHRSHRFEDAAKMYKVYLGKLKLKDEERIFVKNDIRRCLSGIKSTLSPADIIAENLGDNINTAGDEYRPVESNKQETILYFTALRNTNTGGLSAAGKVDGVKQMRYKTDVFQTTLKRGTWSKGQSLDRRYNTGFDEELLAFSEDGSQAFFSQSANKEAPGKSLKTALFDMSGSEETNATLQPMTSLIDAPDTWQGDFFVFNDTTFLFSSTRPGGFGGKDLYVVTRSPRTGYWSMPRNLGAQINTPFDETAPFLARDGRTLFFSSNNTHSIGGFDIFKAVYVDSLLNWTTPQNIGQPINSASDDSYYRLADDGLKAYFASNRHQGNGGWDIYQGFFKKYQREHLFPRKPDAFVYVNQLNRYEIDAPKDGSITPFEEIKTYIIEPVSFNEDNNRLTPAIKKQVNDVIKMLIEHPYTNVVVHSHTANDAARRYNLYSSVLRARDIVDYMSRNGVTRDRISIMGFGATYPLAWETQDNGQPNEIARKVNRRIEFRIYGTENRPLKVEYKRPLLSGNMETFDAKPYYEALEGLAYRVQITSSKQMYSGDVIEIYKNVAVETIAPDDQLMRYAIGLFSSYYTAKSLKDKLAADGFEDAFIVPYINGRRTTLEEAREYTGLYPDLNAFIRASE